MRTFKTLFAEAFEQRPMSITKQAAGSPFGFPMIDLADRLARG